jgi:hypothetical protein
LGVFLTNLSKTFAKRKLKDSKENKDTIGSENSKKLLKLLIDYSKTSLFSKNKMLTYCSTLSFKHLAFIEPNETFKEVIELIEYALNTLTGNILL